MPRDLHRLLAAVLMALSLCGCGVATPDETAPSAESSEAGLTCQVFQECPDGGYVTCMSEGTACLSGTDLGGWVECDQNRGYCVPACSCTGTMRYVAGFGETTNCNSAMELALASARSRIRATCSPNGACSENVRTSSCTLKFPTGVEAFVTMEFVCKDLACPY